MLGVPSPWVMEGGCVMPAPGTEDEKHLIEMEKRYFGKLNFRKEPALHAEQFKIVNVATGEELASVGS